MDIDNLLQFLTDLKANNNREWFAENKARYDQVRLQFEQMCKELITGISAFDEEIKHVEVKDCVFRIYRDTRFSNDKTPYKTHFGVYIASDGGRKSKRAGYYLHLDPTGCFIGSGVWCPDPVVLKALRQSVYDNIDELNEIRTSTEFSQYYGAFFEEDKLKTVPRGFPKDFPDAELLKLKHYLVEYSLDDTVLHAPDFVSRVTAIAKCAYPFNRFLNYTVDEVVGSR
ncbi:MAG: DUF2461 domain-containing protein [Paludibacter sp.]|nr:DUF2461 domain-containing protein [Paludibacter sp.]